MLTRAQYVIIRILFEYSRSKREVANHNRIKDRIEVAVYPLLRLTAKGLAAIALVIPAICDSPTREGIPGEIVNQPNQKGQQPAQPKKKLKITVRRRKLQNANTKAWARLL